MQGNRISIPAVDGISTHFRAKETAIYQRVPAREQADPAGNVKPLGAEPVIPSFTQIP